eukprot:SAG22_NODE_142_length_17922_cov_10.990406_19_plen_106_part_00
MAYGRERGAPALAAMVGRVLQKRPTTHFYWRSTTALCANIAHLNPAIATLNRYIEAYLCSVPGVRLLDGFAWTEGKCKGYDDNVHHSVLGFSHAKAFLQAECGID